MANTARNLLIMLQTSTTDAFKPTSKIIFQKTAKATDYLIVNKRANKITKVSKNSPHNNSETFTNEEKMIYISRREKENYFDLRTI